MQVLVICVWRLCVVGVYIHVVKCVTVVWSV